MKHLVRKKDLEIFEILLLYIKNDKQFSAKVILIQMSNFRLINYKRKTFFFIILVFKGVTLLEQKIQYPTSLT